jgi:RNA polymerase sigma factor (TIGR02999 family)
LLKMPHDSPSTGSAPSARDVVTTLLVSWRQGDPDAVNRLFPVVYRELQRLARHSRRRIRAGETLRTTALVHEAYLKLVDNATATVQDRQHFFALAAQVMRQVLLDAGRRRVAGKRGGGSLHVSLEDVAEPDDAGRAVNLMALDAALDKLGAVDERLRQIVELRVFCGLTVEQTAEVIGASPRTVKRDWRKARAFLLVEISSAT